MSIWSISARSQALRVIFLRRGLTVGLIKEDWREGPEESAAAYARQRVKFGEPEMRADGAIVIRNKETMAFPPYEEDTKTALVGWVIYDQEGQELVRAALVRSFIPPAGLQVVFMIGDLEIGLRGGVSAQR